MYFTTNTMPMKGEEEYAVVVIARASESENRNMPIEVDSGEEEDTMMQVQALLGKGL